MHPDSNLFVTAARDRSVNLWRADAHSCVAQARLPSPASSVCFHPDGKAIAIGLTSFEFVVLKLNQSGNWEYTLEKAIQRR